MKRSKLKNITLSADEDLIERARQRANAEERTLNSAFRDWLEQFTRPLTSQSSFATLMDTLSHVAPGRRFSRDDMNER